MGFQYYINSLADRVRRGVASVKERAMLEYYEHTRGNKAGSARGDWFSTNFFNLPFSYSRMNDWVHYRQAEYEADLAVRQGAEQARRNVFLSGYNIYKEAKDAGYRGSFEQWQKDYLKDAAKLDLERTKYNPTPGSGFFKDKHSPVVITLEGLMVPVLLYLLILKQMINMSLFRSLQLNSHTIRKREILKL